MRPQSNLFFTLKYLVAILGLFGLLFLIYIFIRLLQSLVEFHPWLGTSVILLIPPIVVFIAALVVSFREQKKDPKGDVGFSAFLKTLADLVSFGYPYLIAYLGGAAVFIGVLFLVTTEIIGAWGSFLWIFAIIVPAILYSILRRDRY